MNGVACLLINKAPFALPQCSKHRSAKTGYSRMQALIAEHPDNRGHRVMAFFLKGNLDRSKF